MLARTPDDLVDADALLDLYGAVARQAVLDYQRGPAACGERDYETARVFLEQSGLMGRAAQHNATSKKERGRES